MIFEWQMPLWRRAVDRAERMPHALLFAGPAGGGKRVFAEALAARVLCANPGSDGHACGLCDDCLWRLAGNHPDLLRVVPEADQEERGEGAAEKPEGGKAASRQIVIEQIRALQQALTTGGHRGSQRVVIVDPAEAMNVFTANALLKLLEEPTTNVQFLLISSSPKRLLPTIRSRCQTWTFARPPADTAARWLAERQVADADVLLAFAGGMPLAASELAEGGGAAALRRFVADVSAVPAKAPLRLAGEWDSWLKSKDAQSTGLDMATLTSWLQRWIADLVSLRLGGPVRFFPTRLSALQAIADRLSVDTALGCYNEITQSRRVAQHPLNARLFLEDMLLRYARCIQATATVRR
ncbi:DNA polymerase III subunit delta' [Zoogloea sp.]|uniref:DNA polymerase III subunit delta' n=1 Tax=Zoogloea sp. TaxID=49181 RepID=UPI0035B2DFB9